jgi:glucokinase
VVEYANNLPFTNFPIASMLSERFEGKSVYIENDANAAALGEAVAGAAKGTRSSVMITLGTGVGGGIIIDGKVYSGFNFVGGELGHMVIEKDGVPCSCGRCGCWESYSSATALIRMTKEKIEECRMSGRVTAMSSAQKISGRTACDAMRAGDAPAKEVYDKYISYLATGLANIINIFQPEVISLGGGISNEGQSLIDDITPLVRKQTYGYGFVDKLTSIRIAQLGNDAGIIGAAAL